MKKLSVFKPQFIIKQKSQLGLLIISALVYLPFAYGIETAYKGNEQELKIHTGIHNSKKIFFVGDITNPTSQNSQVTVDFTTTGQNKPYNLYGGLNISEQGSASENTVIFNKGEIGNAIFGGFHRNMDISLPESSEFALLTEKNSVILNGNNTTTFSVIGGSSSLLSNNSISYPNIQVLSKNNSVDIHSGSYEQASGGNASSNASANTTAENNYVNLYGGKVSTINGAMASTIIDGVATANNNTVNISGGEAKEVYGAQTQSNGGTVISDNNTVQIDDGKVDSVYGGLAFNYNSSNSSSASGNRIIINGGFISNEIIAGAVLGDNLTSNEMKAVNNTVTITNASQISGGVTLLGGYADENHSNISKADVFTGNTLNFSADSMKINTMGNFEYYNFLLPSSIKAGQILITVEEAVDVENSKIKIVGIDKDSVLLQGDRVILINNTVGDAELVSNQVAIGTAKLADIELINDNGQILATLDKVTLISPADLVNPQTKAYLEGRLAGLVFTNQGTDLVAQLKVENQLPDDNGYVTFGSIVGGDSRYKTGSHIDVKGSNLLVGIAKQMNNLTLGGFFEAGWGNYDSHNSFATFANVKGDGDVQYRGFGLLSNYSLDNDLYLNGALHLGRVKTDFDSNDFGVMGGIKGDYDSSSTYYSAHLGVGYKWQVTPQNDLDIHLRYLWTYIDSDSVLTSSREKINLESIQSHRINSGFSYDHQLNPQINLITGLAYEYEFDGKAKGTIDGLPISEPDTKGGSGIAEIGLRMLPSQVNNLSINIYAQGYVGKREGFLGGLKLNYNF